MIHGLMTGFSIALAADDAKFAAPEGVVFRPAIYFVYTTGSTDMPGRS
jgi:hypothetical protein